MVRFAKPKKFDFAPASKRGESSGNSNSEAGTSVGGFKKRFNGNFVRNDPVGGSGKDPSVARDDSSETRIRQLHENDRIDNKFGFSRLKGPYDTVGWLLNMHPTEVLDEDKRLVSAVDYYFLKEDGSRFRATLTYSPYFYVLAKKGFEKEVQLSLTKKYGAYISAAEVIAKEDLDLPNHLVGLTQKYLKLSFRNVNDLMKVRKDILPAAKKNHERDKSQTAYAEMLKESYISYDTQASDGKYSSGNHLESIIDIREYDVPYHMRVAIDNRIFIGYWYQVTLTAGTNSNPVISRREDIIEPPDCIVLAYDIETTKSPLKFPDSSFDQIMMISYMIDGQGFLITNREIVSSDVDDFEYTPKPEFEGRFTLFNEANEMSLLQRFFDHILDIKPHIFTTYNGDFFDWPFVEARAKFHGLSMVTEIGFAAFKEGIYSCRPCIHMDCFNWVQRDSYLPVGSQNLKAVAKAKLRYDPVELDPEDMCRMASEQPQVLATYSVSDAVATYYLYMKYVHPFIFALCTIIPLEPDEVLRKGTGTLCEALLMVEAFQVNVIFPNKQETVLNKMTSDGHVLDSETYVGGHVEALESGVFRSDIPCRFKLEPEALTELINGVENTLKHALEEEEQIPLEQVTNLAEVTEDIKSKLVVLRDNPMRQELPLIYHLDVGAMYPNIILTNRLQPSAIVNEVTCASCDFNKPDAKCKREMGWTWRGEFMPASRSEFQRIQQQLETERFPSEFPGAPMRAFHQLSKEERSAIEKKRLTEYCRRAYRKTHVTRTEVRQQTVCMQENSFYVDTVRAFRDRRYEFKGLSKVAKKEVVEALASGDADDIKSAKNREVLYDSLQLAYKCILNSFYGYVMRKGARWMSMEMAGIVCYTGGNIIRKAREIIEKVGKPLELDTDGIWCCLPSTFPENFVFHTTHEKKVTISYPNAVLNLMVKAEFTNDQYHDLVNPQKLEFKVRKENSIFFEVDGPYLAMILPASKEEGKRLKKRYAVYNSDKTLAELKGFEVKRRGELQLIKNFQSSVFDAFLLGDSLESCYASVAKVADYWLDVLYSKAQDMPDSELFDLISENRSMSRKLEDYGQQKSTSISTAKRLAEFLGDQMVKDAGLSCRFVISKKPDGAPVTERAIPLAIFQAEPSVKHHFLRRWLKDNSIMDFDIRTLLDWNYYIERLSGTIQKIVTIPAAMQGIPNPVPRINHPDWLHKRIMEKNDVWKQRKINEIFKRQPKATEEQLEDENQSDIVDVEDIAGGARSRVNNILVNTNRRKRNRSERAEVDYSKHWKEVLGPSPPLGDDQESIQEWLKFHKKKWEYQKKQRIERNKRMRMDEEDTFLDNDFAPGRRRHDGPVTIGGFLRRAQQTLFDSPWQVFQVIETGSPGVFKVWALIGQELHQIKLNVPRIFYINQKEPKAGVGETWRKCMKTLPRAHQALNLYEYTLPEIVYQEHSNDIFDELGSPKVEGIYETQVPLEFRVLVLLGCVCSVDRKAARRVSDITDTFDLNQLCMRTIKSDFPYLDLQVVKHIWIYQHKSGSKSLFGIFIPSHKKVSVFILDTVRTANQMPNLANLYNQLRNERLAKESEADLPEANYKFEVTVETNIRRVFRAIQGLLTSYKDEKKGPTVLLVQSSLSISTWSSGVPSLNDFPAIPIHVADMDNLYQQLEWQKVGSKMMIKHYLRLQLVITSLVNQSKFLQVPIANIPADAIAFGCDILYARNLLKQNFVLWCSPNERPDLGGKEAYDNRLITEFEEHSSVVLNYPGCYKSVCVEIELDGLAVNTLLQAHHVHDIEGTAATVAFDTIPQASLDEMIGNTPAPTLASYDEAALCSHSFRVLKSMVGSWLRDLSVHRSVVADYHLIHFYRWLRSPSSLLYEPALKKTLHNLMKKLFVQLIAEFMRLGSKIVYADFSRIIVCTKKNRVCDAIGYIDFVTSSMKGKELFHGIHMRANYGGIKGDPEEEARIRTKCKKSNPGCSEGTDKRNNDEEQENDDDGQSQSTDLEPLNLSDEEEEETSPLDMHWTLMNYLPGVGNCKKNFVTIIGCYLSELEAYMSKCVDGIAPGETPVHRKDDTPTPRRAHDTPIAKNATEFAKNLIKEFTQRLFEIIQKLDKKYPTPVEFQNDLSKAIYRPPNYEVGKPALELVKAIDKVLSLDANVESEMFKLRRNLLKLIGVAEFSNPARWVDPSMSVILPEVICKMCVQCRDIDLCKDLNVRMENNLPVWVCPNCDSSYESAEIEQTLVDIVNRKLMGFFLQDLQCTQCKGVKEENIREFCSCAGKWKNTVDVDQTKARLETFHGIAKHFGMPLLLQNTEWILEMSK